MHVCKHEYMNMSPLPIIEFAVPLKTHLIHNLYNLDWNFFLLLLVFTGARQE